MNNRLLNDMLGADHEHAKWLDSAQDVAQRTRAFIAADGQPMAELINWMFPWDDKTIVLKDGALMACFAFEGLDIDSTSTAKVNSVRKQLQYAMEQLQELGICITWQVRRRLTLSYPDGDFPDQVSAQIDALQKRAFLSNPQYINLHHVCLISKPAANSMQLLSRLARSQQGGRGETASVLKSLVLGLRDLLVGQTDFAYGEREALGDAVYRFEKLCEQFLSSTSSLGVLQLKREALGGFLTMASSPVDTLINVPLPDDDQFLDTCIPRNWINNESADHLEFTGNAGRRFAACYTLQLNKRESVSLDMLDALLAAPFELTLSHVFQFLPRSVAQKLAAEVARYHGVRKYSLRAYAFAGLNGGKLDQAAPNLARAQSADEAQILQNQVAMGQEGLGLWHGTVMVLSPSMDQLQTDSARCETMLESARLLPIRERLHKLSSFCATVPGSHGQVARWSKLRTQNLSDLAPLRTVWQGEPINAHLSEQTGVQCTALMVLPTRHLTPYFFTGYVGDLGHLAIIGPSGTGKTTFCNLAFSSFRKYPGARVFVFDKNFSVRPTVLLQGGSYIDLTPENQSSESAKMSPLRALMADGNFQHLDWCLNFIELLAKQRGYKPTDQDRLQLEKVLRATVTLGQKNPEMLRLSSLVTSLDMSTPFALALMPWTHGQALGAYFDNETDGFELGNLGAVEMAGILGSEELAAPFMSYAFYRIATALRSMDKERPPPTFIYVPEAWYFIKNQAFQDEFSEWLVTLRKLNAAVWLDTQSPDKLVESGMYAAIRDNIATTVFTPNEKVLSQSLRNLLQNECLLNDEAIQFIADGQPKQDYFIRQGGISRRVRLQLDDATMAYLRSDKRAQSLVDKLRASEDPHWRATYIQTLGKPREAGEAP